MEETEQGLEQSSDEPVESGALEDDDRDDEEEEPGE